MTGAGDAGSWSAGLPLRTPMLCSGSGATPATPLPATESCRLWWQWQCNCTVACRPVTWPRQHILTPHTWHVAAEAGEVITRAGGAAGPVPSPPPPRPCCCPASSSPPPSPRQTPRAGVRPPWWTPTCSHPIPCPWWVRGAAYTTTSPLCLCWGSRRRKRSPPSCTAPPGTWASGPARRLTSTPPPGSAASSNHPHPRSTGRTGDWGCWRPPLLEVTLVLMR